jgi:hypothetical protein
MQSIGLYFLASLKKVVTSIEHTLFAFPHLSRSLSFCLRCAVLRNCTRELCLAAAALLRINLSRHATGDAQIFPPQPPPASNVVAV